MRLIRTQALGGDAVAGGYRDQVLTGDPAVLNRVLEQEMAADPGLAFSLNRGMLTHGAATPLDYIRGAQGFTIKGLADKITCPTMICSAENDVRGAGGKPLYGAMTAPKE